MSKLGMHNGKVLVFGSKLQFGCECCCHEPEYRYLAPPQNDYIYIDPATKTTFQTSCEVRYCDTIKLYLSEDDGATYSLVGTSGVYYNAWLGALWSQSPTYGNSWIGPYRMQPYSSGGTAYPPLSWSPPKNLWWYLQLENNCGASAVQTAERRYSILSIYDPEPIITCNGCPSGSFQTSYVTYVTNAAGVFLLFQNGSPFMMTHYGVASACTWKNDTDFGQDPFGRQRFVSMVWVPALSRWRITIFYSASAGGGNVCDITLNGPTTPCNPRGTYVYASCRDADCVGQCAINTGIVVTVA